MRIKSNQINWLTQINFTSLYIYLNLYIVVLWRLGSHYAKNVPSNAFCNYLFLESITSLLECSQKWKQWLTPEADTLARSHLGGLFWGNFFFIVLIFTSSSTIACSSKSSFLRRFSSAILSLSSLLANFINMSCSRCLPNSDLRRSCSLKEQGLSKQSGFPPVSRAF